MKLWFLSLSCERAQKWKPYHLFQVLMLLSIPLINSFTFPGMLQRPRSSWIEKVLTLQTIATY